MPNEELVVKNHPTNCRQACVKLFDAIDPDIREYGSDLGRIFMGWFWIWFRKQVNI